MRGSSRKPFSLTVVLLFTGWAQMAGLAGPQKDDFKGGLAAAPADTSGFVAYCAGNFEACRSAILDVNNMNLMYKMGLAKVDGATACTYPHPGNFHDDSVAATKPILDWLKAHVTARRPKTFDAIQQALAALWPSECTH